MKIGYLINQYPKISHSFIRREIMALEKAGNIVCRYSVRTVKETLVDNDDIAEATKTHFLLTKSAAFKFLIAATASLAKPKRILTALKQTYILGRGSEAGLVKHFIYFLEACVIARWCKQDQVEHIHAHFGTNSATVALLTSTLSDTPFSFTVHGPEEFDKPQAISLGYKIEQSAFTVAISSFGKSQLFRHINFKFWPKVKVVHCGLDNKFHSGPMLSNPNNRCFVCVGRLCEQKGQLLLVQAAKLLKDKGYEFQLVLVGDGPMRSEIEATIEHEHLTSIVSITGWKSSDGVRQAIENCSAMVLPSFAEGLPVVIMEAMALGRPVISTYIAGIPELVMNNHNGWLVPAGDLQALAEALEKAIQSSGQTLNAMGETAKARVLERHNITTETKKLANLIAKLKKN